MDALDDRILHALSEDGRISNVDLADRVGLSPSACLRRVQALERSGVIRGYRAVLDPQRLGVGFIAYVSVGLSEHSKQAQHEFEAAMAGAPEIRECHNVTGAFEYLLRIELPDLASYKRLHTDVIGTAPHVTSISTHVVIESPKDARR